MKAKTLINLFDIHNEAALLAIEKIRPSKVIYLVDKSLEERFRDIENYEIKKFNNIIFENLIIEKGDIPKIEKFLDKQDVKDTIINVTGGERINALIVLNKALIKGFNIIYIDALYKNWYEFGSKIKKIQDEFNDIKLKDITNLAGTNIINDSTSLSKKNEIVEIVKMIYKNLDVWYTYKSKLYDGNIFIHDSSNINTIHIKTSNVLEDELKILLNSLKYLQKLKCINYKRINEDINVEFLKEDIKSLIFKSGTWLEVLTEIVIREIENIDEVKSGVVFLWNEGRKRVRNELDVLAVKDSILICVSCKDSEKYDEDALNELDVYSKRLGGDLAKKILVATKKPCKECVSERAKIMGINLVILDKDIEKFKKNLKNAIEK